MSLRRNLSPWISAAGAETRMRRYNVIFDDIISSPLRGYEPPAEFSAWISAASAETRMRRYNVVFDDIIS